MILYYLEKHKGCNAMHGNIEDLRKNFLLNDEDFENYYKTALNAILTDKERNNKKRLIIVGGQCRSWQI